MVIFKTVSFDIAIFHQQKYESTTELSLQIKHSSESFKATFLINWVNKLITHLSRESFTTFLNESVIWTNTLNNVSITQMSPQTS